jgi:L-ascorbate metabolism protein UlaG (beta-lactamase superfamily)
MALAAGLLVASPVLAAPKAQALKKVKIIWHGQSFFEIVSSKGTRIVTDPHEISAYGRIDGVLAHVITCSHLHNDHTQVQVVMNNRPDTKGVPKDPNEKPLPKEWKKIKPKIIYGLKKQGDKRETWNTVDEKFVNKANKDTIRIRNVKCYHDPENGTKFGLNTIFIFEVDGINIVHLGDLGHKLTPGQVKEIGKVDVLLIPVGGVYTINGDDAKEVVKQLKPKKYIIPMHCATRVYDELLSPKEFLEDQPKENIARTADNMLEVNVAFKPPSPIIVVLNWEPSPLKKKRDKDK